MRKQMALYLKEDVALSLDFCYDADTNTSELFYGTDSGHVGVITLNNAVLASLTAFKHIIPHVSLENGNGLLSKGLGTFYKYQAHADWALQTKYFPFLHAFFSCSRDEGASIVQHARRDQSWLQLSASVPKGVNSFAVCKTPAVLIAGGTDHYVRMFNPYRLGHPTATLPGHKAPISLVTVSEGTQQAITLSLDMNVRIWYGGCGAWPVLAVCVHACVHGSLPFVALAYTGHNRNLFKQTCVQSITEPGSSSPVRCITALYAAPNGTLVTASTLLTIYPSAAANGGRAVQQNPAEHRQPIVAALYNPLYGQVMSGCQEGVINVWDVESGGRVKTFHDIHGAAELTALALDSNYKRIITGALGRWCVCTRGEGGGGDSRYPGSRATVDPHFGMHARTTTRRW
jgi:WD40 repeat protein